MEGGGGGGGTPRARARAHANVMSQCVSATHSKKLDAAAQREVLVLGPAAAVRAADGGEHGLVIVLAIVLTAFLVAVAVAVRRAVACAAAAWKTRGGRSQGGGETF